MEGTLDEELNKRYFGKYTLTIDSKGRLMIPSCFRKVMRIKTTDNKPVFIEVSEKNGKKRLNLYDREAYTTNREQIDHGEIVMVNLDSQGRLLIPQETREYVGLEGRVVAKASRDGSHFYFVAIKPHTSK